MPWFAAKQTRKRVYAVVAIVAALGLGAVAGAHSVLKSSDPAEGARLKRLPEVVKLSFNEPVELTFSVFKVYPLPAPAGSPSDLKQLNGVAAELVSRVLSRKGDEPQRADAGLVEERSPAADVVIRLKPNLKPGAYAVMWRVLSVDTHTTRGFFVFVYAP